MNNSKTQYVICWVFKNFICYLWFCLAAQINAMLMCKVSWIALTVIRFGLLFKYMVELNIANWTVLSWILFSTLIAAITARHYVKIKPDAFVLLGLNGRINAFYMDQMRIDIGFRLLKQELWTRVKVLAFLFKFLICSSNFLKMPVQSC